jgi:hypothetical protein
MSVLGAVSIFQYGAGPNGVMRTLGKFMLGSGATFGYDFMSPPQSLIAQLEVQELRMLTISVYRMFMSIGSIIRTEGPYHEAWRRAHAKTIILPREFPERR